MKNKKSAFRHTLLNILTQIHIAAENLDDTYQIQHLVRLASILVKYETLLLNNEIKIHKETFALNDILEIARSSICSEIKCSKKQIQLPKKTAMVTVDKNLTKDALLLVLQHLAESSKDIQINWNNTGKMLTIQHKAGKITPAPIAKSNADSLQSRGEALEWSLVEMLLKAQGTGFKSVKNTVKIMF